MKDVCLDTRVRYLNTPDFSLAFEGTNFSTYIKNVTEDTNNTYCTIQRAMKTAHFDFASKQVMVNTPGLVNTSYTKHNQAGFTDNLDFLTRIKGWDLRISPDIPINYHQESTGLIETFHATLGLDILHFEPEEISVQTVNIVYMFGDYKFDQ